MTCPDPRNMRPHLGLWPPGFLVLEHQSPNGKAMLLPVPQQLIPTPERIRHRRLRIARRQLAFPLNESASY